MTEPAGDASEPTHEPLPRVLGLFDSITVVVGSMIGSGIFLKVGNVDKALAGWGFLPILAVWIFVGLITLCGSLALAELGAMFPHAGGPYLYLRAAFGKQVAFLWGWIEFWVVRTGSVGALACATAIYLDQIVPLTKGIQALVAIAIVVGLSVINGFRTRWGANVQNVTVVIKILFLGLIIFLPILMSRANLEHWRPLWSGTVDGSFWKAVGVAMIAVLWPYDGWINLGPVAEEIREPQRNVPRAMALGIGIVILVYVGANLSYHLVMSMAEIAATKTVASDVFQILFGPWGRKLAALGVMCSTFGAVNSNMLAGPRIYLAVARDGLLHRSIHQVHGRFQTPVNAIAIQCVWTTFLIVLFHFWKDDPKSAFDGLTDSVICAGLIFYSLAVGSVYVLRQTQPERLRPYRTWGYPWTPAILLLAYFAAFTSQLLEQWQETFGVLVFIAVGSMYFLIRNRRAR